MLIRLAFGSRAGHVIDMSPHEARAMLADGRATLPDAELEAVAMRPSSPVRVESRDPKLLSRRGARR